MASYGLALNSDGIGSGSGIHLYFALQTLMSIPATIIVLVLADKTGRKRLMISAMLVGGSACIGTMFTTMYGGTGKTILSEPSYCKTYKSALGTTKIFTLTCTFSQSFL